MFFKNRFKHSLLLATLIVFIFQAVFSFNIFTQESYAENYQSDSRNLIGDAPDNSNNSVQPSTASIGEQPQNFSTGTIEPNNNDSINNQQSPQGKLVFLSHGIYVDAKHFALFTAGLAYSNSMYMDYPESTSYSDSDAQIIEKNLSQGKFVLIRINYQDNSESTESQTMQLESLISTLSPQKNDKVILIGHSRGGLVNAYYTALHPDKVSEVISIGTPYNPNAFAAARQQLEGNASLLSPLIQIFQPIVKGVFNGIGMDNGPAIADLAGTDAEQTLSKIRDAWNSRAAGNVDAHAIGFENPSLSLLAVVGNALLGGLFLQPIPTNGDGVVPIESQLGGQFNSLTPHKLTNIDNHMTELFDPQVISLVASLIK